MRSAEKPRVAGSIDASRIAEIAASLVEQLAAAEHERGGHREDDEQRDLQRPGADARR